jgi:hypothetical protein
MLISNVLIHPRCAPSIEWMTCSAAKNRAKSSNACVAMKKNLTRLDSTRGDESRVKVFDKGWNLPVLCFSCSGGYQHLYRN